MQAQPAVIISELTSYNYYCDYVSSQFYDMYSRNTRGNCFDEHIAIAFELFETTSQHTYYCE